MRNFIEFIRTTWWLFLVLFIAPIIVIAVFGVSEYMLHKINLSAGDWAGLLGDAFGYWGTVFLGVIAFWQNVRVNEINERLLSIEEIERKVILQK